MGTWIKGYKVSGGKLFDETFEGGGDLNDVTWQAAPDPSATSLYSCMGEITEEGIFEGIDCLGVLKVSDPSEGDFKFWEVDVEQNEYFRSTILMKLRALNTTGTFEMSVWKRNYSDATTYVEANITNIATRGVTMYFSNQYLDTKLAHAVFFQGSYGATNYMFIGLSWQNQDWLGNLTRYVDGYAIAVSKFSELIGGDIPGEVTSPEFGKKAKKKGGYNPDHHRKGTFDDSSDRIDVDSKPYDNPFRTGFINGYYVTPTQLAKLSEALFPEPGAYTNDIPQMIHALTESILNSKRVDYVLDLLIVPVEPTYRSETVMNCGGRPLRIVDPQDPTLFDEVKGHPIDDAFVDFDCGRLTIPEYWANFLDFVGTKVKLFLPYVGYIDIEPEYINGGELHVWYRFNVFDGSFMAYVESTSGHSELEESLISQYAGVAAIHIPVTGQDYSNKVSGLISAVGAIAAGAAGGGALAPAAVGAAASIGNTLVQKPGTTHANGYNASSSYLSHRTPYLIIERQSSQFSEKYPEEVGLPLYMEMRLGDCHGLTIAKNAHLDTIPADVEVKDKISQLLSEGIIL